MRRIYGEYLGVTNNEEIYRLTLIRRDIIDTYGHSDITYEITKLMADIVKKNVPDLQNKVINFMLRNDHNITREVVSYVFDYQRSDNSDKLTVNLEEHDDNTFSLYLEVE